MEDKNQVEVNSVLDPLDADSCANCKMLVFAGEYHPYTACVLYRQLGQADKVRSCLDALRAHFTRAAPMANEVDERLTAIKERWVNGSRKSTHWDSCYLDHHACAIDYLYELLTRSASLAEDNAAFHRGVDAAKEAIRTEVDPSLNEDVHFYAAMFINSIARKCGLDRPAHAGDAPLRAALEAIRDSPHCSYESYHGGNTGLSYATGVVDGHRCAANIARDALAAPAVAEGWLPIESAPKTGESVLLANGKAVWEDEWYSPLRCWAECALDGTRQGEVPTHWRPKPHPPTVPTPSVDEQERPCTCFAETGRD